MRRVVRHGERLDLEASHAERRPHRVLAHRPATAHAARGDPAVQEERHAEGARERLGVGEVVAVVVRDDDGVDAAREEVVAELTHALGGHARADPRVDENAGAARLDEHGVARGAAGEDEDAQASGDPSRAESA